MPHTPPVPPHVACPESSCGRLFRTPRDLKVHSHVHSYKPACEELQRHCPVDGCSFKCIPMKRLDAHIDKAHRDPSRQFLCEVEDCGFSTTSQASFTGHYRKRHLREPPPSAVRTAPPPAACRRARHMYNDPQHPRASTSRLSEPPTSSISRFHSLEPPASTSAYSTGAGPLSASVPSTTKYYPAAVYYFASPPPQTSPATTIASELPTQTPGRTVASLPRPCPPSGPHSDQCVRPPGYASPPRALRDSYPSSDATWVSWRDECDIASETIAVATGERVLCERSMWICTTEYLPVSEDIGMVDKRFLWA
ncbi:hypothetical protein DFH09DRAFT_1500427 [Mycena vulgaris]|nr:hypothetical protein DFH09DRAFT_1500427 [Mycena vulgaris]